MADPEAVILSAIESLECWLLKKGGLVEENLKNLYSLIVEMSDLEEEKKEMVQSLLLQCGMEENEYVREIQERELYNLLDLNREKIYSLLEEGLDFWEDYKGKIYYFLFWAAEEVDNKWRDGWGEVNKEKLRSFLFEIADMWGDDDGELNKEKLHSLLVEITDLWGDVNKEKLHSLVVWGYDEGELNKEKLHSLLVWGDDEGELNKENLPSLPFQMMEKDNFKKIKMMCRISDEVAGLWKDKQPKLNKEKLYTWLANNLDLCEPEKLFGVLIYASSYVDKEIREGVEGAKREFRMILDLMRDKKLGEESSLRYFISDVVDMAHHAHFLIHLQDSDPFALFYELSILFQLLDQHGNYHNWFGEKFKHIVNGLQEIKESMLGFRVERLQNIREMEGSENVVGLEEDVELLLRDEGNGEATVIIRGTVGSGKTTLARQVYNHTTIAQQFERRAWVCLSKVFSRKEMLVSLIRQVVDSNKLASLEKIECADYKSLKQLLRHQLLGTRYFIVLDDVWDNTTHIEYVIKALPRDKGCRLLLTTRFMIRDYAGVKYHKMKSMDDDKSWTLLLKTLSIEGSDEQFPKPLVKKARQILRKCSGLPLAIKEVGRNWAKERQSGSEWEELIQSIDLSETLAAMESVYQNWGREVKSCFLHLAFFKEGATIRAKKLVQIWMALGVVSGFEEFTQNRLQELCRESVIDIIDMNRKDFVKRCYVHAVFHRLSIIKANDELNFEILGKDGDNWPSHQPHHRAIYCSREKLMNYSSNQDKHLVSLFFYGGGYFNSSPSYWKHFEKLKTLDMEDFGLKILPDVIGMLSELIYLGLRNNYIQVLPHSLSLLKKLEVLDIALNFMVEVEDIIWEMDSLRHLYMTDISCRKPLRVDTLKNLQTWTYVSVHNWTYKGSRLEIMTSLTRLGIQEVDGNTDVSNLFASLAKLKHLRFLILRGFRFKIMPSLDEIGILPFLRELTLEGLITRLPSANNFPRTLERLNLVNSRLHEDPMPTLEKISNLTDLKLQNAYTGQQMVISLNGFSKLKFLVIAELWHLTNVQIEKDAMKMLEDLEINNCPNLETLPEDYCPMKSMMMFKMKTTKKNATKIRESSFISRIKEVDIQP